MIARPGPNPASKVMRCLALASSLVVRPSRRLRARAEGRQRSRISFSDPSGCSRVELC